MEEIMGKETNLGSNPCMKAKLTFFSGVLSPRGIHFESICVRGVGHNTVPELWLTTIYCASESI
jgi:hypothetical protein